ncbi:MAG: hypothetical protein HY287_12810 [Planctomycetes bacterium]|nr:hypothetical protein [Planctomycetota bacterium]MBI3835204.1 hypothetical protein [Planctomycetota bacterium]
MIRSLRDEALRLLQGDSEILKIARDVTRVLRSEEFEAVVIGGVSVALHGHLRTTCDVNVLLPKPARNLKATLESAGYEFHRGRSEFTKKRVPVQLVFTEELRHPPTSSVVIDGIPTVDLADLIQMKLELGLRDPLRAQDLADVIGLIRANRLSTTFASQIRQELRPEFRKLARAVAKSR